MDRKYGRIFTISDVEKIMEYVLGPEQAREGLESTLKVIGEDGVRFKFDADEPTFTLRGRDTRAIAAIRFYFDHQSPRAPLNHTDGIEKALKEFEDYRRDYPDQIKEPD